MISLDTINISGKETLPLIEGGKGVAISNGMTAGKWALSGGVGTFSAVNADNYTEQGEVIRQVYKGKTRVNRHEELVRYGIDGGVKQAQIAHEVSEGKGRIHMNILWEMGGAQRVLEGVLEKTRGLVHGVTCGAGMPFKLAEITARFGIFYYPIISSVRAFKILFKRAYSKFTDNLGAVVYEDPWLAGGHNGLSNSEDPTKPELPFNRVLLLRDFMRSVGLDNIPIIMAGGVWHLDEWEEWINNPKLGPIAFQFGTRPLLTKESPIPVLWKEKLFKIKKGDIKLHRFSPTGFYSSAVQNGFLDELSERTKRQVKFSEFNDDSLEMKNKIDLVRSNKSYYVNDDDKNKIIEWGKKGYTQAIKTPDNVKNNNIEMIKTKLEKIK